MSSDNNRRATQVDAGWRSSDSSLSRNATQVDTGWRTETISANERKATQVDKGWRDDVLSGRKATEIDRGWRTDSNNNDGRQSTQVDVGWRQETEEPMDLENIMNAATANYFSTIEEFKTAVEKIDTLKSSNGNVYSVKKTISRTGGESIILLCSDSNGNDVAAKVYYEPINGAGSSVSSHSLVLEYMRTEEGKKYTLAVTEIGLVEFGDSKYYFEIMPYCKSADLSVYREYSFDQIVEITRQLNEALHSIHQAGIIHRDIKPENLYEIDGQIKLGDFGIAKQGEQGHSHVTEHILGSEGYTAPETKMYIYSVKIDYYSLGVTLASLFEGHFVFDNMKYEEQAKTQEDERLPLTRVDPNREQLENLLNGLCRMSSKQRFGYEEVNRWLADHNYTGGGTEDEWPKAFGMLGSEYRDEKSLFMGITKDIEHWNEGKTMLYDKYFENFFKSFKTELARDAQLADELYRGTNQDNSDNPDKGLFIFLKKLFAPGPIVWKGYTFNSLFELGEKMMMTKTPAAYSELLKNQCISHWLSNTEGISVDDDTMQLVNKIEFFSIANPEVACYWFGNSFTSKRKLNICKREVSSIEELINALFEAPNDFYQVDGYSKLVSRTDGADLYGFLYSLGYKEIVEKVWEKLESCDTFHKATILISMLDDIAVKANVNPEPIRNFYINYGPIGMAVYTKKLVDGKFYMALDAGGKQMLGKISKFKAPESGSVDELSRAYLPLVESVEKMRCSLIENPYCILTGVYESKGIICTNLAGCFAFKIFDRLAPLGFNAWIEAAKGGVR